MQRVQEEGCLCECVFFFVLIFFFFLGTIRDEKLTEKK